MGLGGSQFLRRGCDEAEISEEQCPSRKEGGGIQRIKSSVAPVQEGKPVGAEVNAIQYTTRL